MSQIVAPNWVFGVGQFHGVIQICHRPTRVAMVTKIWLFVQKIGYNSVYVGEKFQVLVPNWVFFGWANLMGSCKFVPDRPFLPPW